MLEWMTGDNHKLAKLSHDLFRLCSQSRPPPRATGPRRPRVGWTCNAGGKEEDAIQFLYLSIHTAPARHDCHVAAGA